MRSASRLMISGLGLVALAGCATTMQEAARLQINSARIRASQLPVRLSTRSSQVDVAGVRLISRPGRSRSVVVVRLRNRGSDTVSDLPLLVGLTLPQGRRIYLNARAGLDYFQNHVPALEARRTLSVVLTVDRRLPTRAVAFARVGESAAVTTGPVGTLPSLRIVTARLTQHAAALTVENLSGVPQLQLPVYAVAQRRGRLVAAGQASVTELDGGASLRLRIPLIGQSAGATLSLEAPPTIFR